MNCPQCGKQIAENHAFCDSCGARLKVNVRPEKGEPGADLRYGKEATPKTIRVDMDAKATSLTFGRYRAIRELGRGAMGIVFLARDDKIGRNVAIKVLDIDPRLPESEQQEIRHRFEREARAAGILSHPNIVTVHDVGEEAGIPYIAMEHLEGASLSQITSEGPLSIEQATAIIAQVLSALSYAHGHDVVHRDIKPDNIFLLPDGRVKVADFGIARIASSSTMTEVGQVIGTPGYMSPEQVNGEVAGPASDIFSAGVLFYKLLTGAAPFASSTATIIMYKIVHEQPKAPHLINPRVPPNLEAVIVKATAKSPFVRYNSAAEMLHDIETGQAPSIVGPPVDQTDTVPRPGPMPAAAQPAESVVSNEPRITEQPAPVVAPVIKGRTRRKKVVLAAGALVTILVVLAVILLLVPLHSSSVKVPGVIGKSQADAKTALEKSGFKTKVQYRADNSKAKGTVLSQSPKNSSSAAKGATVTITVASIKQVDVPNVVGAQQDQALATIKNASLTFSLVQQATQDQGKHGLIISQNPGPGLKADPGTPIALVVAVYKPAAAAQPTIVPQPAATTQPTTATVPTRLSVSEVIGLDQSTAMSNLQSSGFMVAVTQKSTSPDQVGKVLSQSPAGGTQAEKGSTVIITVGTP